MSSLCFSSANFYVISWSGSGSSSRVCFAVGVSVFCLVSGFVVQCSVFGVALRFSVFGVALR